MSDPVFALIFVTALGCALAAGVFYAACTVLFTWPLPAHLATHVRATPMYGMSDLHLHLWTLVSFELWCRTFLDRGHEAAAYPPPAVSRRLAVSALN